MKYSLLINIMVLSLCILPIVFGAPAISSFLYSDIYLDENTDAILNFSVTETGDTSFNLSIKAYNLRTGTLAQTDTHNSESYGTKSYNFYLTDANFGQNDLYYFYITATNTTGGTSNLNLSIHPFAVNKASGYSNNCTERLADLEAKAKVFINMRKDCNLSAGGLETFRQLEIIPDGYQNISSKLGGASGENWTWDTTHAYINSSLRLHYVFPTVNYDWFQANYYSPSLLNLSNYSGIGFFYYYETPKTATNALIDFGIQYGISYYSQDTDISHEANLTASANEWRMHYVDWNYISNTGSGGNSQSIDFYKVDQIKGIRFSVNGVIGDSDDVWIDYVMAYDFDCGGMNWPRSLWQQDSASNIRLTEGLISILAYLYNNPDSPAFYHNTTISKIIFEGLDYFVNNYRADGSWSEYEMKLGLEPGIAFPGSAFAYAVFLMENDSGMNALKTLRYPPNSVSWVGSATYRNDTYRDVIADVASHIIARDFEHNNYTNTNTNLMFSMYFPLFADYYFNNNETSYSYWTNITKYDNIKNFVREAKGMTWFVESSNNNWDSNAGWDNKYNGGTQLLGLATSHKMQIEMMARKGIGTYVTPIPNLVSYWENVTRNFVDYTNYYHLPNPSRGNEIGIARSFVLYNITEDWDFQNYYPGIYDTLRYPYINRYVFDQISLWNGYGSIEFNARGGWMSAMDSNYCVENATSLSQNSSLRVEYPQNRTPNFWYLLYNFSDELTGQSEALIGVMEGTQGVQLDRVSPLYVPYILDGEPYNISVGQINSGKNYTYEFRTENFTINVSFIPELSDFVQNITFNFEYDGVNTSITGVKNGSLWTAIYTKPYYIYNATNITNATHYWRWHFNGTYIDGTTFSNTTALTNIIVYPIWYVTTFTLENNNWMETDSPIIYYSLIRYNYLEGERELKPTIFINYSGSIIKLSDYNSGDMSTGTVCRIGGGGTDTYCNYITYDTKIPTPLITNYSENKSLNTYFEVYYGGVTYRRGGDGWAWQGTSAQYNDSYTENGTAYMMVVANCSNASFANYTITNFSIKDEDTSAYVYGNANNIFRSWARDRTLTRTWNIPITNATNYTLCKMWPYSFNNDFEVIYWVADGENGTTNTTLITTSTTNINYNETGNASVYNSTTVTSSTTTQSQTTATSSGYGVRTHVVTGEIADLTVDNYTLWLSSFNNATNVLVHAVDELDAGWISAINLPVVIEAYLWQATTGTYTLIQSAYTDLAGKVQFSLNPSAQKQYYFQVKVNDSIVFPKNPSNPNKFALTSPYDYWLRIPRYGLDFLEISTLYKNLYDATTISWDNITGRVTATWTGVNATINNLCFAIYNVTNISNFDPYTTEYGVYTTQRVYRYCTIANDGSIFYDLGLVDGEYFAVLVGTFRTDGHEYMIKTLEINPTGNSNNFLGGLGFFLAFLLVGTMVFAGLELGATSTIIISSASLIILLFMPLALMSKMALIGLSIVGLIIGLLINR